MQDTTWMLALVLVIWAGWMDWRSARIPNWLTVSGLVVGVAGNTILAGEAGAWMALKGAGLALAVLLPCVLLRGLGAGDWKLMGAIGAMLGPQRLIVVLLGAVFVSGVAAVIEITRLGRWRATLVNLWHLFLMFLTLGLRARPGITLDNPKLLKLPFGTAAAVATVLCYGAVRIRW
jgi:prepilin peptidase CpaA